LVSPGCCKDTPFNGFYVAYGEEEVLAHDVKGLLAMLETAGLKVEERRGES